jgi:microcystin-dependent protein
MTDLTDRLALKKPVGADSVALLRVAIADNATILDEAAMYAQGTLAARPAVGTPGQIYRATDVGITYLDDGTTWLVINPGTPPIGAQMSYAGTSDPAGGDWVVADGRLLPIATYPVLDAMIGEGATPKHVYNGGANPGAGQFKIPDKRGRVSVGAGTAAGAYGATAKARGARSGEETHLLATGNMPLHTHPLSTTASTYVNTAPSATGLGDSDYYTTPDGSGGRTIRPDAATSVTGTATGSGGGGAHNNMQPYEVDNYIIRVR